MAPIMMTERTKARRHDLGHHGKLHPHGPDHDDRKDEGQKEVEKGPAGHDDGPLPEGLLQKGPLVVGVLTLPLHDAGPTEGQKPEAVVRIPFLEAHQSGAETQAELIDLDPELLGEEEVAEFMEEDDEAEYQNGNNNLQNKVSPYAAPKAKYCRSRAYIYMKTIYRKFIVSVPPPGWRRFPPPWGFL